MVFLSAAAVVLVTFFLWLGGGSFFSVFGAFLMGVVRNVVVFDGRYVVLCAFPGS